jgi:hypothetical protein
MAQGHLRRVRRSRRSRSGALVLHDVSTLYFETDAGDGFREPGFSKERRLEPQITIGVRHEALCVRREVQDLPRLPVAGGGRKLRAA